MKKLSEGKTKIIYQDPDSNEQVIVFSKDDITAGNGAKHDVIIGKGAFLTQTTSNVFELLRRNNIPVSFIQQVSENEFKSFHCKMIPLEVVTRRSAFGSFLKRNKEYKKGDRLERLVVELYLKTKNKLWNDIDIPVDDPLIRVEDKTFNLFSPEKPLSEQQSFLCIKKSDIVPPSVSLQEITRLAENVFVILEEEWEKLGYVLVDMKIEFGISPKNELVISDVIDNDSWRLLKDSEHFDKQLYRDGADLEEVKEKYEIVANLTNQFL